VDASLGSVNREDRAVATSQAISTVATRWHANHKRDGRDHGVNVCAPV
jgi:hypothetical protein